MTNENNITTNTINNFAERANTNSADNAVCEKTFLVKKPKMTTFMTIHCCLTSALMGPNSVI